MGSTSVPDRLPVHAGRLQGDVPAAFRGQPVRELEQLPGGRPEGAHLALDPAIDRAAQAGHHRVLVHVKAGAKRMKKIHRSLLCCAAGVGSRSKEFYKACSGSRATLRRQSRVLRDPRSNSYTGSDAPRDKSTSLPTAAPSYREPQPFHPPGSAQGRWQTLTRNDRKFLEALHYFTVHNITW